MLYKSGQLECISTEEYFYLTENFEVVDKKSAETLVRYLVYDKRRKLMDTVRSVMQNELTAKERNIAIDYWQNKMSIGDISEKYCISRSSFYRTIDTIKKKLETSLKYVLFYNEILKPPHKEDFLSQIKKATSMEAQFEN
ncbi:MAG: sigma-70 family RNA polymerase sigma factor [Clostridia bacterium]|nr:sigma-70 family RNA polymerase sigma factor [Clostridia bacterium]